MRSILKTVLPTGLVKKLRRFWDSTRRTPCRWLRSPGFETYAYKMGRENRNAFQADQALGIKAVEERFAPFQSPDIPKIIWMFWQQGEQNAPFVVRRCIDSWRRYNPGWEVRVLDDKSVKEYADMSDFPVHLGLPVRFSADLLRLRLLNRFGGVWADATVYCHRPLDDWATLHMVTGFFAFRHPGPSRWIESWFLIAAKGNSLTTQWEQDFTRYLAALNSKPGAYFVFFYILQWRIRRDPAAFAAWTRAPSLPAQPSLFMIAALRGTIPAQRVYDMVACGTPVSKLTWKEDIEDADFDALCAKLDTL